MSTLETRVKALESDVAFLKEQLETAQTLAGIQRGLDAVAAGKMKPARQVIESLRKKHKIARK